MQSLLQAPGGLTSAPLTNLSGAVAPGRDLWHIAAMTDRQFKPDLTGSDETLEHLLDRLRSFSIRHPAPRGREVLFSSRRPPKGAGGAEAPIPKERPAPDLYAPM